MPYKVTYKTVSYADIHTAGAIKPRCFDTHTITSFFQTRGTVSSTAPPAVYSQNQRVDGHSRSNQISNQKTILFCFVLFSTTI